MTLLVAVFHSLPRLVVAEGYRRDNYGHGHRYNGYEARDEPKWRPEALFHKIMGRAARKNLKYEATIHVWSDAR